MAHTAFYLFYRWNITGEPLPCFRRSEWWASGALDYGVRSEFAAAGCLKRLAVVSNSRTAMDGGTRENMRQTISQMASNDKLGVREPPFGLCTLHFCFLLAASLALQGRNYWCRVPRPESGPAIESAGRREAQLFRLMVVPVKKSRLWPGSCALHLILLFFA